MDIRDIFIWMKTELCQDDFEHFVMRTWAVWNE